MGVPGKSYPWVSETEVIKPMAGSMGRREATMGGRRKIVHGKGHVLSSSLKPALSWILYFPA